MKLRTGTSGFSYSEWKGKFYPERLAAPKMLGYYAERLNSVEINNTFYRLPRQEILEKWAAQVPPDFAFVLKANRRITHQHRLKEARDPLEFLIATATAALQSRLGPILFQLPPYLRVDVERLRDFLPLIPDGVRAAFEFRHQSWFTDAVYQALADRDAALAVADTGEGTPPLVDTAPFGYVRMRRADYSAGELATWAERLRQRTWQTIFVFFKHEDAGAGPRMAQGFGEMWEG